MTKTQWTAAGIVLTLVGGFVGWSSLSYRSAKEAHIDVLEARIDDLVGQVKLQKDYSTQYHAEVAKAAGLQTRLAQAQARADGFDRRLSDLLAQKWEERYHVERIDRVSKQEELQLATGRHEAQIGVFKKREADLLAHIGDIETKRGVKSGRTVPHLKETLTAFDKLLAEKMAMGKKLIGLQRELDDERRTSRALNDKVTVLANENKRLLDEALKLPEVPKMPDMRTARKPTKVVGPEAVKLGAAVKGLGAFDARLAIISGVKALSKPITGEELAYVLTAAKLSSSFDRRQVIEGVSDRLLYPLHLDALTDILKHLDSFSRRHSLKALTEAEKKFKARHPGLFRSLRPIR